MDSLEQKIKEYVSSVEIPDRVKPEEIRKLLEDNGDMTAGVFLRKLKELKISGSDFLELLGNSKIGNMEFRRIEENPHLKFDELLQILDNSVLTGDDYRMIIAVATQRKELTEQRKRREEETLRRMTEELTNRKNQQKAEEQKRNEEKSDDAVITENAPSATEETETAENEAETTDNTDNALTDERTEAAKAMISRIQEQLDKVNNVENVENGADYTESNSNASEFAEEEADSDISDENEPAEENTEDEADNENSITQEFTLPEPPQEDAVHTTDEAEDFDGIISDDEMIAGNAKDIGSAIGELMNSDDSSDSEHDDEYYNEEYDDYDVSDDEDDCVQIKRSKACLITAFIGAAILVCGGFTLNVLQANGTIPDLIYKVPEKLEQNITDYASLVEQAQAAKDKITYTLPDSLFAVEQKRSSLPKNVYGETLIAAVNGSEILGAKVTDGKLSGNFSFDTGLENAGIVKCGEYFAVIGGNASGKGTVVRTYDESGMISGKVVDEYILSGEFVDYYTNGSTAYLVTYDRFDIMKASADKLTSFLPSYKHGKETAVIPISNIYIPNKVNTATYYTTTAIDVSGKDEVKVQSILTGDAAGCAVSENGMYVTDSRIFDGRYYSTISYTAFSESMSVHTSGLDDTFINPYMVDAMTEGFATVGTVKSENSNENTNGNVLITSQIMLSYLDVMSISGNERIESISGKNNTVTVTTGGEKPVRYSVDVKAQHEVKEPESTNSVKLGDNVSAEVTLKADKDGNRTGIVLAVGGDKKAEVTITAESSTPGDWNKYLASPVCDDITKLAYGESGGKIIIGIPVVYFDGISQVSQCKFYSYADGKLTSLGDITLYDEKYETLDCEIAGGDKPYLLTMWDNRVITASADKVKLISDTKLKTVEKKDSDTQSKTDSKTESTTESKGE